MKAPRLSFRSEGLRQWAFGRSTPRAALPAAAMLVVVTSALAVAAFRVSASIDALHAAQEELAAATDRRSAQRMKPAPTPPEQTAALERIVRQLNTPWPQLLDALEASLPDDVALVSIEPDAAAGKVRLLAEAKTLDALMAYAAQLRNAPGFSATAVLKHETNEQDANKPVRLSLEARFMEQAR